MDGFFAMGGYAAYVWPAYALTAAVLVGLVASSWRRLKSLERDLAAVERDAGGDAS
jgi:heme exporter protein D